MQNTVLQQSSFAASNKKYGIIYSVAFPLLFAVTILMDLPLIVVAGVFFLYMLTLNRHEMAAVLLLAFPHVLGMFNSFTGIGVPATVELFALSVVLLNFDIVKLFNKDVERTLFFTVLILFVIALNFYFTNPTQEGSSKLSSTIQAALGAGVGFSILISYKDIDFSKIAAAFLVVAFFYLWIAYDLLLYPRPESIIDFSSFRDHSMMLKHSQIEELAIPYHKLGYCGLFYMAYSFAEGKSLKSITTIILVALSVWICLYSGARQTILGIAFIFLLLWALQSKGISFSRIIWLGGLLLALGLVISNLTVFEDFSDSSTGMDQKLNRSYDYPIEVFERHPLMGAGYGNYQDPTGEVYAHNIFLEILSEMGLFGMMGLLLVLVIFAMSTATNRRLFVFDKTRGLFVLMPYAIRSLISGGLNTNIQVFVVIFASIVSMGFSRELIRK